MKHLTRIAASSLLLALSLATCAFSQPGRLLGTIARADNKEPIANASVLVEEVSRGAASDLDGSYYVLALPPESYTILVRALGYRPMRFEGVSIGSGETVTLNVVLTEEAIEMEPVTVTYKRPPVNVNEATQRISIQGELARTMPVRQTDEILSIQPGVTRDRDGLMHLRGGRAGEIGFIVDGLRVEDPLQGTLVSNIGRESLHELQLLTGTFSAEYGQAMSGLVNIVTREGGDTYHGSFEYESAMLNESPYRVVDWASVESDSRRWEDGSSAYSPPTFGDSCDTPISTQGRFSGTFSGPVPFTGNRITFFLNGVHQLENSELPFGGVWDRRLSGKLAMKAGSGKLVYSFGYTISDEQKYNHAWKYEPTHYHIHAQDNTRMSLTWTQTLGENFFYDVIAGLNRRLNRVRVFNDWEVYIREQYKPREVFEAGKFFASEDYFSSIWRTSLSDSRSLQAKATWQANSNWQLAFGGEFLDEEIKFEDMNWYTYEIEGPVGDPITIAQYYINEMDETPLSHAAWLQNTFTTDGLVIDAGLRYDYIDPNIGGWTHPDSSSFVYTEAKEAQQLSPRLGIAHPVNENLSLFFSYGRFFQFPDFSALFINSSESAPDTLSSFSYGVPIGNPNLEPERTIAYEAGLKGITGGEWGWTATAFVKDVSNLLATATVATGSGTATSYFNVASSEVIGVELAMNKVMSDYWSLQANYTYSIAKGDASDAVDETNNDRYNPDDAELGLYAPEAWSEFYMSFDRRHVANAMLTWQTGEHRYPHWAGSALRGLTLGAIFSYASGLPYTEYYDGEGAPPLPNEMRMGSTFRVDLRAAKTILFRPVRVSFFVTVENLFDRINPLEVDRTTGEPWSSTLILSESSTMNDRVHDPSRVDIPRIVRAGITLEM